MKKFKSTLFAALLLGLLNSAFGEDPAALLNDNFEKDKLKEYLAQDDAQKTPSNEEAAIKELGGEDGRCLVLWLCSVRFKSVPVKDNVKYTFSFESRVDGMETIETNPDLKHFLVNAGQNLPNREYYFFDAEMKPVGIQGKRSQSAHTLPFGKWRETQDIFYPPAKAAFMQVVFNSRGFQKANLYIRKMKFSVAPDEGSLNCNPAFKLGKYNYSGWPEPYANSLFVEMDGKLFFEGGNGEPFPISEPGEYQLFAKGIPKNGEKGSVAIEFIDADGKALKGSSSLAPTPEGVSVNFTLPAGAKRAKLSARNCVIEEVRVTRAGSATTAPEKKKP